MIPPTHDRRDNLADLRAIGGGTTLADCRVALVKRRISDDDPVAASVLGYFRRHPQCVDDLEGIARWRLLEERVDTVVSETARALDRLVSDGLLECIDTPGLRQRYRLATEPRAAARKPEARLPQKQRPLRPRPRR